MSEHKPVGDHHDLTEPKDALITLACWLRGHAEVTWSQALQAGMFLALHVLKVTGDDPHKVNQMRGVTITADKEAMAARLDEVAAAQGGEGVRAFDWTTLLPMLLQIVQMILNFRK